MIISGKVHPFQMALFLSHEEHFTKVILSCQEIPILPIQITQNYKTIVDVIHITCFTQYLQPLLYQLPGFLSVSEYVFNDFDFSKNSMHIGFDLRFLYSKSCSLRKIGWRGHTRLAPKQFSQFGWYMSIEAINDRPGEKSLAPL